MLARRRACSRCASTPRARAAAGPAACSPRSTRSRTRHRAVSAAEAVAEERAAARRQARRSGPRRPAVPRTPRRASFARLTASTARERAPEERHVDAERRPLRSTRPCLRCPGGSRARARDRRRAGRSAGTPWRACSARRARARRLTALVPGIAGKTAGLGPVEVVRDGREPEVRSSAARRGPR